MRVRGDRYLQRIFTPHELDCCRRPGGWSMDSLAARFSAKEATIKVLRPSVRQPAWGRMEVRRRADGSCDMALSGTAAELAEAAGITCLSVSMTHEGSYAAAVVFALCESAPDSSQNPSADPFPELLKSDAWKRGRNLMRDPAHPFATRVRMTLADHARLPVGVDTLQDYDDLFQAGMSSHASVNVMLALEEEFDIEFPEEMLQKSTFESIEAICTSIAVLSTSGDPA